MLPTTCLHGHELQLPDDDSSDFLCPLCGSDLIRRTSDESVDPSALALTVVPVSDEGKQSVGMLDGLRPSGGSDSGAGSELEASEIESTTEQKRGLAPTTSFVATGSNAPKEKLGNPAPTEPELKKPKKSKRGRFRPPSVTGIELMDELGRGGMGVVYRAYDEKHGRDVALKTLQRMGPDDLVRFKQEFRALADIAHPNLASLYELYSDGRTWCFTMELLHGVEFLEFVWSEFEVLGMDSGRQRFAEAVPEARLSLRRINRLYDALKQLAIGLNQLHLAGKLHSDIKPSNVLVTTESRLVLLDFGLIAEISRDEEGRVPQLIQGTPHYMAPEQAACGTLTEASDWYAVGVMLYEVLTGRLPFRDKSVQAMLRKQYEMPVAPKKRKPGVPDELNDLCMGLLEIDPANRPSTADVLRAVEADEIADQICDQRATAVVQSVDLVGREEHFSVLNQSLEEVEAGETRSVFVHGRSGMGKSVLLRHFLDSVRASGGAVILEGRCYEQESVPFKALDSLIDALVVFLGELDAVAVAELLPRDSLPLTQLFPVFAQVSGAADESRPTIESADQFELRQRATTALRELLTRLGRQQPVVLYIDDLQWGDEDSSNLLADLVRPPESPRLLLLGSYRREEVDSSRALRALATAYRRGQHQPHRHELAVDPLSADDAARLATSLLGRHDRTAGQLAAGIAKESGGSPFFVWELAQHVRDGSAGASTSLELDEVIWSRVCRLPGETRRLLQVFAVAGRPMRASEAYETIDGRTQGPGLLAQLRTSNFIRTNELENDTVVETYHDRIRESVVNHLAAAKVRGHHLKIALVIEQASGLNASMIEDHIRSTPDFVEPDEPMPLDIEQWQRVFDLAFFFDAAGKSERALPYALIAAERAWQQNAFDVAEQQFEIARRGADGARDPLRFRIAEGLGEVLMTRGRYDQANQHFQTARQLAADNVTFARIDGKRGYLCFKKADMANAAGHFSQALTELGNAPPGNAVSQLLALMKEGLVQVLHTGLPGWFVGQRQTGTDQHRMDLFRARLYDGLGYPYWFIRGPVPTLWTHLRHLNLAERYPPSQELGRACSMHAIMMTAIPLADRGVSYAERSYEIHGGFGDRLGQGKARSFQTFSLLALGRFREGSIAGREAVRLLQEAGDVWEANMARIILSLSLYYEGHLQESHLTAKLAYEGTMEVGDFSGAAIALYFWAPAAARTLPDGALQRECEREREDPLSESAAIQGRGVELLMKEDKPAEAAVVLEKSLAVARQRGIRNPAIFCGVTWKALALRRVAEREPDGPSKAVAIVEARKAASAALRITKRYRTSRAEALREAARVAVLMRDDRKARRLFHDSLRTAIEQEAAYEVARTELALAEFELKLGTADAEERVKAAQNKVAVFTSQVK